MLKQQRLILEDNSSASAGDVHATYSDNNTSQENGSNYPPNQYLIAHPPPSQSQPLLKRKRNLPGNPDPEAEVISLSPKTLMATNRFVCEVCNKGFQRDQNLQLHRRGHNLPWKLKQRNKSEVVRKKVYVCPEVNCVHHEPSRALGDLTGIKKHFSRKHGEKKWKCDKCSKKYAVQSDWKAHSKTCGTREYKCDCGTLFSRRDSFITHRAFCDALAEESARSITGIDPTIIHHQGQVATSTPTTTTHFNNDIHFLDPIHHMTTFLKKEQQNSSSNSPFPSWLQPQHDTTQSQDQHHHQDCSPAGSVSTTSTTSHHHGPTLIAYHQAAPSAYMSATALLQKAAQMGTAHLSKNGTSIQAPCTISQSTMILPHHHQQYQTPHVSSGNNNGSTTSLSTSSLVSQEEMMIAMASFKEGSGGPSLSPAAAFHHHLPNVSLTTMMMMNNNNSSNGGGGFADVTTFEDTFGHNILDAKKEKVHHHDNKGMTRDFLGLKPPYINH
uniref:protein indeterminate-domain 7-like n=1 Tax=Erigeron canadensis TaxID=72917 RepID=UPI001CB88B31|nr:protein indeterminate-domain 7-like [Erigeron canadensis]